MSLARHFKDALKTLESKKVTNGIVARFNNASLKPLTNEDYSGRSGAEQFWQEYLDSFKTQQTEFSNTLEADKTAVLKWTSKGKLPDGKPINYRGVSVLEHDRKQVGAFRIYFDSAVFTESLNKEA